MFWEATGKMALTETGAQIRKWGSVSELEKSFTRGLIGSGTISSEPCQTCHKGNGQIYMILRSKNLSWSVSD